MRYLRAVLNFAMAKYTNAEGKPIIAENPVNKLTKLRAWYEIKRRKTIIKEYQIEKWANAVLQLESERARDYLILVLLTGLRRREAAKVEWVDVDLKGHTLFVRDPKNHSDFELPLSNYLIEIMERRQKNATSVYVFPGDGQNGFYRESRGAISQVCKLSGVPFCIHDLRRTFITIAESLDISAYAIKALVNHSMNSNDVTAGYILMNVERLRKPMQRITD